MIKELKESCRVIQKMRQLKHSWYLSTEQIVNSYQDSLKVCLTHAIEKVPYYSKILKQANLKKLEDNPIEFLREMPLLTKEIAKSQFPDKLVAEGYNWKNLYSV